MHPERARKKARTSPCKSKVSALGYNRKGELILSKTNLQRFVRKGGGVHAELRILSRARKLGITRILICRVGKAGTFLPIEPCEVCRKAAEKLKVRIETV